MTQSILVLGGAGFIGSHIVEEFLQHGHNVTILDNLSPFAGGNLWNTKGRRGGARFIEGDIVSYPHLSHLLRDADIIIDSMGLTRHSFGFDNPMVDFNHNLVPQLTLIEALRQLPECKTVIYLGTRSQYGATSTPADKVTESSPFRPIDPQGVHKAAAEWLYELYAKRGFFRCISLRIVNCFGERQTKVGDDIGLIGLFIRNALKGHHLPVYDGSTSRQFIYAGDLAAITRRLTTHHVDQFLSLNVADRSIRLLELAHKIIGIVGRGDILHVPSKQTSCTDVGSIDLCTAALCSILGDKGIFGDFDAKLKRVVDYFSTTEKPEPTFDYSSPRAEEVIK